MTCVHGNDENACPVPCAECGCPCCHHLHSGADDGRSCDECPCDEFQDPGSNDFE
jgi:hypothetical protein